MAGTSRGSPPLSLTPAAGGACPGPVQGQAQGGELWGPSRAEVAQPFLSQCPAPFLHTAFPFSCIFSWVKGHEQRWVLGHGTPSCSQGLYLYTGPGPCPNFCPEGASEELSVGRPWLTGGKVPRAPFRPTAPGSAQEALQAPPTKQLPELSVGSSRPQRPGPPLGPPLKGFCAEDPH